MIGRDERWQAQEPVDIDHRAAHPARVYDYLLGGRDHFSADREAAERGAAALPGGLDRACHMVRSQREFLRRSVEWLAGEVGIRQFLDIGTGIPNGDNVHAVARLIAPDSRIVYVDNDPVVLAHAATLLRGAEKGTIDYLQEDLRRPYRIVSGASHTLDLSRPVGLILVGVLHLIGDHDNPWRIVDTLLDDLVSGSYLVISHLASDLEPELVQAMDRANETMSAPFVLRNHGEVARLVSGVELVEPGIVTVDQWQPGTARPSQGAPVAAYAAVGVKPRRHRGGRG